MAALVPILVLYGLRYLLIRRHAFDPDEFQHLHGAWCIAHGLLPYRDYFDHHTPWLHFFLAPLVASFDVGTNPAEAERVIFLARGAMWVFSGLALGLTCQLGRLWRGRATGWAGTLLLSTCVMFLDKTMEIRPDVPAVAFLLGSWTALLAAVRRWEAGQRAYGGFVRSGFLLGVALLCTQKALFALPALGVWLAGYIVRGQGPQRAERLRSVLAHAGGVLLPIGIVLAVFAGQNGLGAFVESNLLVNFRWPVRFSAEPKVRQLFHDNGLLVVLALAGLATAFFGAVRERPPRAGRVLVPMQALGLAVGAWVIPVPTSQYLVMLLPLAALLAGDVVAVVMRAAVRLPAARARELAVAATAAAVMAFSLRPLRIITGMLEPGHTKVQDTLDRLRYVLVHVGPQETVLDGFSGLGVFRPHAYFYYFLHDEVRTLLAGGPMGRLLAELRDGTIAPDWVVADRDVLALPADIVAFLRDNYVAAEMAPLWARNPWWLDDAGGWLDLGAGSTDGLVGRGWSAPDRDGMRSFRQARARRATVRVPVRKPAACRELVVHARAARPGASVRIAINGEALGVLALSPAWGAHAVALHALVLRRGVNALELTYEGSDPAAAGVEVDGLRLRCINAREFALRPAPP
jgi:hypothetical protein